MYAWKYNKLVHLKKIKKKNEEEDMAQEAIKMAPAPATKLSRSRP